MRIEVYGVQPKRVAVSGETISRSLSRALGVCLSEPEFTAVGTQSVMRLRRRRKLVLECARVCRANRAEAVNGDTAGLFENEYDYVYAMICDGMGSGRDAALTSRLAELFVEKLLRGTRAHHLTLELLNRFLLARTPESFTTVDLLEVDLLSGEGHFIKAGAAPSYVVRGENVFRIASATPPAGILESMTAEKTRLMLSPGDKIVMVSDGVAGGETEDLWLPQIAVRLEREPPTALAAAILEEAARVRERTDDMTVFVMEVKAADEA